MATEIRHTRIICVFICTESRMYCDSFELPVLNSPIDELRNGVGRKAILSSPNWFLWLFGLGLDAILQKLKLNLNKCSCRHTDTALNKIGCPLSKFWVHFLFFIERIFSTEYILIPVCSSPIPVR